MRVLRCLQSQFKLALADGEVENLKSKVINYSFFFRCYTSYPSLFLNV